MLQHVELLDDTDDPSVERARVHVLMGGVDAADWHLEPEYPAVIVGTQDMILSRALNRGYACARPRWPMEFGLLNQDALWVLDEVQLMDVGLATSAQLQAFRHEDRVRGREVRPVRSWWMSATLQPSWLDSVDVREHVGSPAVLQVEASERRGGLWSVEKPLACETIALADDKKYAQFGERVMQLHAAARDEGHGRITLVIVNTVDGAQLLFDDLARRVTGATGAVELRLAHSRFRPAERSAWRSAFLSREACVRGADRIVVATQVVEAGVDVSATTLVTEVAPWPSLVQRFGRAARYGGTARVVVVDRGVAKEGEARPYSLAEIDAVRAVLPTLHDVAPARLEPWEEALDAGARARLYPYAPKHLLVRREIDELFDTSPDLTGVDLDVSRFIRSGDERDVQVFWAEIGDDGPSDEVQPAREGLCPVPVHQLAEWLDKGTDGPRKAWRWDYLAGEWRSARGRDARPGGVYLIDADDGGYDLERGWSPKSTARVEPVEARRASAADRADLAQDRDDVSRAEAYKTIATHGAEAADEMRRIADALGFAEPLRSAFMLAARWHDAGKAHPVFDAAILPGEGRPERHDLAKAPKGAWRKGPNPYAPRRGFRHELVSTLALFETLRRVDPDHPALGGDLRALVEPVGGTSGEDTLHTPIPDTLARELAALDEATFDLVAWLVCAHHGKVRGAWQATPHDQDATARDGSMSIRGVRDGDALPEFALGTADGGVETVPALTVHLDAAAIGLSARYGRSWSERAGRLLRRHGPFALAWFETLLRVADVRATRRTTSDPILAEEGV